MNKKLILSLVMLSSVALSACSTETPYNSHPTQTMASDIKINHAKVVHSANKNNVTAIYLDITDKSSTQDVVLIAATADVATEAQLHRLVNGDMVQVKNGIDIAPNSTDKLEGEQSVATGGYHIMLIQLKQSLHKGQVIPVKLIFQDGSSKLINVPVR